MRSQYPLRPIAEVVDIISGVTYDKGDQVYEETDQVILPDGTFKITKKIYLREDLTPDSIKRLYKDDIFICMSSGSKAHVGKCAMIPEDLSYFAGGFMGILRKKTSDILTKYLWAVLSSKSYRLLLGGDSVGSNINNIGGRQGTIKIPLPPLAIQQEIVDEIEQIEAVVFQAERDLSTCQANIENLINTVAAPQEKPLGRIVVCNPSKSTISDMPNTMSVSNDGHIVGAVDRLLGDVRKGSYTYFQENDIIIAKITPCMENGKCALAVGLTNGIGMGSSEFYVFRCGDLILPGYLFAFLNRSVIRIAAEAVMTGKSGHRRVPIEFYQRLLVPLPPLSEQKKIIAEIQQIEDKITQLNMRLDTLKAEKNAVLKKYLWPA